MNNRHQRPAKRVIFSPEDTYYVTPNGGSDAKFFKQITTEFRDELILKIEESLTTLHDKNLQAFAVIVELEPEALAKSHRPTSIFNDTTCPFIGDIGIDLEERTGRFLIRATELGLQRLRQRISTVNGKNPLAALSTIKDIKPFYPEIDFEYLQMEDDFIIRLMNLEDASSNSWMEKEFQKFLANYDVEAKRIFNNLPLYRVKLLPNEQENSPSLKTNLNAYTSKFLLALQEQSMIFSIQKSKAVNILPTTSVFNPNDELLAPHPNPDEDYPVVAVVDSSIRADCPHLSPWYVGEETAIIDEDKDYTHGTFVAGLITNAYSLNNFKTDFPKSRSKVFSVGVLTATGGAINEIIEMMYRAREERPDIRVWNLSLGSDAPVSLARISEFAILLDEFQQENNCLCVVSAGNINDPFHHRPWPPTPDCPREAQRITSPGDSVMSITVASMAHIDGIVKENEPSIFSRSGPVANFVLKPDLIHFGGNHQMIHTTSVQIGVNSLAPECQLSQMCGTSFSTPLVSTIAANLWQSMGDSTQRHTIKGLLAHSARLRKEIPNEHKVYYGWGMPLDVEELMYCDESEITIIMNGEIGSNVEVVGKLPFPIPDSLRTVDGKIRGEFFMTVSYDSPLDPNRTFEYCLLNIEASLGEITDEGEFTGKIPAEGTGFEQELINGRYKWSPVKVYHKKFAQGVNVENWKLQIKMITREGFKPDKNFTQPFSIILTIRALDPEAKIYDEMTRLMDKYNWEVSNAISIEPQIKI